MATEGGENPRIFLSWAGETSKKTAIALRSWLSKIFGGVPPFMSDVDIDAGARWEGTLARELEKSNVGIICLTRYNLDRPWLYFEAGSLSKVVGDSYVCPYLIGVDAKNLNGPLKQFQVCMADRAGTKALFKLVNKAHGNRLDEDQVDGYFDAFWPQLEGQLSQVLSDVPVSDVRADRAAPFEAILSEIRNLIYDRLEPKLTTKRVFPGFMPKIIEYLGNARQDIHISCDYLAYGYFSDHIAFGNYMNILELKKKKNVAIQMTVANADWRKVHNQIYFGKTEDDWQKLLGNEQFRRQLEAFCAREGCALGSMKIEAFHAKFFEVQARLQEEYKDKICTHFQEINDLMKLFMWIVDDQIAVFSIPSFSQNAREHGFETQDGELIRSLKAIQVYYEKKSASEQ